MKRIAFIIFAALIYIAGCKEEGRIDQIDGSAPAPEQVTVTKVIQIPGGSVIKYRIPNDKNLLAVKAVYNRGNETCETKASFYCDSLIVDGLKDTVQQEVKLYSIGRNEKLSEPQYVTIIPLAPPVKSVGFDINPTFGGVRISMDKNDTRAPLSVILMIDSIGDGKWEHLRTFYTEATDGIFMQKGLENRECKFGLYIRDRWLNCSDTLVKPITPIFEEKLPKGTWTNANYPGDTNSPLEGNIWYRIELLWDDREYPTWGTTSGFGFGTPGSSPMPQHVTINLGYRATLSTLKLWPRQQTGVGEPEMYKGFYPRIFELWGADNPSYSSSFDEWTLLGRWEVFKPSGYNDDGSVGTVTADDKIYFENSQIYGIEPGEDFPDPYIPVTHVRLRTVHTFGSYPTNAATGAIIIGEMTLLGQTEDTD
jgi:hypothetical protein